MSFEFIHELSEARLFRNPGKITTVTASNLADNFFNAILALETLKFTNPGAAKRYALQTLQSGADDSWKSTGSDLHNMAYMLKHQDKFREKLSRDRFVHFPEQQYKTWLRNIAAEKNERDHDRIFLMRLQKDLGINSVSLKSVRRLVADWDSAMGSEKKVAATRIFQRLNHEMRAVDLFSPFYNTIKKHDLLIGDETQTHKGGLPLAAKIGIAAIGGHMAGKSLAKL